MNTYRVTKNPNADANPAMRTTLRHLMRKFSGAATNRHKQIIQGPNRNAMERDTKWVSISAMNATTPTYWPTVDLSKYPLFSVLIRVTHSVVD
jgi:hypothetical protein